MAGDMTLPALNVCLKKEIILFVNFLQVSLATAEALCT